MEDFEKFIKKYRLKRFSKGEVILHQDERPTVAYIIKSGIVKSYNLTTHGEEKPIAFNLRNELFSLGWVFYKIERSQYYYEAFTDCELYFTPREDYQAFLKVHPDYEHQLFDQVVGRYIDYQMRVNALEQSKAADKVLLTLHFLARRFGHGLKSDLVQIQLPLTQQDMANFMGLTRETTGIELKKLERKGVVIVRRQNYVIHIDKLKEILGEEYDQGHLLDRR
jgi:CRP/FNR family transcriptional regulator, anaerobic regulatory protein